MSAGFAGQLPTPRARALTAAPASAPRPQMPCARARPARYPRRISSRKSHATASLRRQLTAREAGTTRVRARARTTSAAARTWCLQRHWLIQATSRASRCGSGCATRCSQERVANPLLWQNLNVQQTTQQHLVTAFRGLRVRMGLHSALTSPQEWHLNKTTGRMMATGRCCVCEICLQASYLKYAPPTLAQQYVIAHVVTCAQR